MSHQYQYPGSDRDPWASASRPPSSVADDSNSNSGVGGGRLNNGGYGRRPPPPPNMQQQQQAYPYHHQHQQQQQPQQRFSGGGGGGSPTSSLGHSPWGMSTGGASPTHGGLSLSGEAQFYRLHQQQQQQQQLHRQTPYGGASQPHGHALASPFAASNALFSSPGAGFDLSQSMSGLNLRGGHGFLGGNHGDRAVTMPPPPPPGSSSRESFGAPGGGAIGSFGGNASPTSSGGAGASPWGSMGLDSDRLRDQMNQQMAALYRSGGGSPPGSHQPLANSGNELLSLLNKPNASTIELSGQHSHGGFGFQGGLQSMSQSHQQQQQQAPQSSFHQRQLAPQRPPSPLENEPLAISGEALLRLLHTGGGGRDEPHYARDKYLTSGGHHRSGRPQRDLGFGEMPRPPRSFNGGMERRDSLGPNTGGGGSTAVVSPEVTKPNDTIKVQVSLLTDECRVGRVLLIGLFRIGQPTNEKPIFVKQVLFENKIHRQARHWNTRITFRAPRSPGEFEFRIFEELKPRHREFGEREGAFSSDGRGGDNSDASGHTPHAAGVYSNTTIVRSNRLKVAMDYSHFIEFLRTITEKFRQNRAKRDTGGILSNLLAFMRLIDQIETVFLHGQTLLEDFLSDLLGLVSLDDDEMSRYPVTETIPSPIETFHGTVRNVLNAVQANPWLQEFISTESWQHVDHFQRNLYCAVSGLYFLTEEARKKYWQEHYGFEPLRADKDALKWSTFITKNLTMWIYEEAKRLIPDADTFRKQRQEIYDSVYNEVVRKLEGVDADLDVFGSSANDFGTTESDMDMCLVLRPEMIANMTVDDKRRILTQVVGYLESRPDLFTDIDPSRLSARIPIVMFKMAASGIECDLCVENSLAQRNTSLLRAYANADERVRVLAFVLKQFVKRRRMNCAAESTLSSYGYLLMLIHFLQRQDSPILPVLQTLPPTWNGEYACECTVEKRTCPPLASASPDTPRCRLWERGNSSTASDLPSILSRAPSAPGDGHGPSDGSNNNGPNGQNVETYFFDPFAFPDPKEKLKVLHDAGAKNTLTVGELFLRFLEFYGLEFDASRTVVSVRMGRELLKSEKKAQFQWKLHSRLSIEDPFETSYDVAHVLKGTRDKYIRQQFVRAYTLLVQAALHDNEQDNVAQVMAEVNEYVADLPFHTHKESTQSAPLLPQGLVTSAGAALIPSSSMSILSLGNTLDLPPQL